MSTADVWIIVFRSGILVLSIISMTLLVMDVWHRRKLHLKARFYWEAMFLFLLAYALSAVSGIANPARQPFSLLRGAIGGVALIYFLISILRVRRSTEYEESESERLES